MRITLNGEPTELPDGTTVAALLGCETGGRAVAVNAEVVRRADHATTRLTDGDAVEVVTAVQGG